MKSFIVSLVARVSVLLCLTVTPEIHGVTTIISDSYNVTGSGTGFALNTGINTGINPPTTRLTGTAKANLRYIPTATKTNTAFAITNNRVVISAAATPGRFVLSADGVNSFDFGSALGIPSASATNRVVYDLSIRMNNDSAGTPRFSFALGSTEGDGGTWDFAFQLYRANAADDFYTIQKRINTGSSGLGSNLNEAVHSLTPNTYGGDITFLMRVTDAGSETTTFNSRVQLSLNGGNSWFYDTDTDPDLTSGWRLNGSQRHLMWDIAGDTGPVTYDAFSLKLNPETNNLTMNGTFKAMSYNIHWAAGPDGKVNTQRIANFILDEKVDIVGFNEVARFWSQRASGRDTIGEIAEQTGMSFVFDNNKVDLTGNDSFGNAILTKYPILFREHRLLPVVADNEQRGWHKVIIDMNGKFISFWTTHLAHNSNLERLMGATNFNQWIADEVFPTLLVGDFNDTPAEPVCVRMEQKWIDIWPIAGDGTLGRTVPCPGPPGARIDYIWKAKTATSLVPTNAEVGLSLEASDHFSVLTQFILTNFTNHATGFYFPCDEGSGTKAMDDISNLTGKFGTNGPSWNTNSPSGQPGDYSLFFNGTKKLVATDTNQVIGTNGLNDSYTLQTWVKVAVNYAPAQRAILFQYDRKPGFSFSINTNRTLHTTAFKIKDVSSTATLPNDGQWHHIAVVHAAGANMKFYIDATLAATVAYTNGAGYRTSNDITIGAADDDANPFTGYLDRIRFDERALTPAEFDFPSLPPLGIRQNVNSLTLFWPAVMGNYTLQANGTLQTNGWINIPSQLQGGEIQATITPTNSARFFRLKRQ